MLFAADDKLPNAIDRLENLNIEPHFSAIILYGLANAAMVRHEHDFVPFFLSYPFFEFEQRRGTEIAKAVDLSHANHSFRCLPKSINRRQPIRI